MLCRGLTEISILLVPRKLSCYLYRLQNQFTVDSLSGGS